MSRNELPTPRLAFYQRSETLGSMVHNDGVYVNIGSRVGGSQETEQYNVAKNIYTSADDDESEFEFTSDDFMVCALPDVTLNSIEHTDVRAPSGSAGKLQLTEAVVVVDNAGDLRMIDSATSSTESADLEQFYTQQGNAEPFKSMREGTETAAADDPFSEDYGYGAPGMMGGYSQQADNRRLRGGRGGRGGAGGPPGMGGYPGAGGPPGMGGMPGGGPIGGGR
jgi:hypothetical protein